MRLSRRHLLFAAGGALAWQIMPVSAQVAAPKSNNGFAELRANILNGVMPKSERVSLTVPPLSENGNSVAFAIDIDAPMTDALYVKRVTLLSPRNPLPQIAQFDFTPASGKAAVKGRMRLGGTQTLTALAEMSDGTFYEGQAETTVTLAACVLY